MRAGARSPLWRRSDRSVRITRRWPFSTWIGTRCTSEVAWGLGPKAVGPEAEPDRGAPREARLALLIDGDRFGPLHWPGIIGAVEARGPLACTHVFGPPGMAHHGAWARALAAERAAFVPVPRRRGGGKDPNDLAMGMHATRLVSQDHGRRIDRIALAVQDIDFVYLAECLRSWGHRVLILLPEGQHRRLAATFEEARAEVAFYVPRGGYTGRGKFKAVLHSSGEGSIEEASADDYSQSELFDTTEVMNMMIDLGYAESDADPLVPALAKFFVTHKLGSLTDSPDLVTRVLTRLGYCHPDSDASLDEAIDVFFEVGMNRSNMAALGHPTPPHAARRSRAGLLHTLLASSRSSGAWQTAPSDRAVRRLLESAGRLPGAGRASRGQVLAAMRSYAAQRELPPRRSYVGLVHEILKHQRSADPSARV